MPIQPYNPPLPAQLNGQVAQDTLTQDEYVMFKAALPSWRDRLIAMLLRNTGLRVNDLRRLEGAEIRPDQLAGFDVLFETLQTYRQTLPKLPANEIPQNLIRFK